MRIFLFIEHSELYIWLESVYSSHIMKSKIACRFLWIRQFIEMHSEIRLKITKCIWIGNDMWGYCDWSVRVVHTLFYLSFVRSFNLSCSSVQLCKIDFVALAPVVTMKLLHTMAIFKERCIDGCFEWFLYESMMIRRNEETGWHECVHACARARALCECKFHLDNILNRDHLHWHGPFYTGSIFGSEVHT